MQLLFGPKQVLTLAAAKVEIDPKDPNVFILPPEWSLVMNVAGDVLALAEELKKQSNISTWKS